MNMNMKKYITLKDAKKNICGRTVYTENGAISLSWSLSGFEMNIRAQRAVIHFVPDYKDEQPVYLQLTLDGRKTKYGFSTGKEKIVIEDLGGEAHTIKLTKLSEGPMPISVAAIELFGDDCDVLDPPAPSELRIEFIGDSITCGVGAYTDSTINENNYYEEDATKSYAGITAEMLNADARFIAVSGQGIINNWAGLEGVRIPSFFEFKLRTNREQYDFSEWTPTVVVINAGTNDSSGRAPADVFIKGADKFLDRVREVYPDAYIIWFYGLMGKPYDAVLSELFEKRRESDNKLSYIPVESIYSHPEEIGCMGHPNLNGALRGAKVLTEAIREILKI